MNLKEDHEQGGVCWCGQEHEVISGQKLTGQELIKWQKENFGTKAAIPLWTNTQDLTNRDMCQGMQDAGTIRPDPIPEPEVPGDTVVSIPLEKLLGLRPGFTHSDLKAAISRYYGQAQ